MQPDKGALNHPARLAQSRALGDAAPSDHRVDAALPQQATVLVEVVAPAGIQTPWFATGASLQPPNRRDGVEQGQVLSAVVSVATSEGDGEWGAVAVDNQVVFRAGAV